MVDQINCINTSLIFFPFPFFIPFFFFFGSEGERGGMGEKGEV